LSAFWFPLGAPEPAAPPCIRQRFFPRTAGEEQGLPERVLAPHRGLDSIGTVLREWFTAIPISHCLVGREFRFECTRCFRRNYRCLPGWKPFFFFLWGLFATRAGGL